MIIGNPSMFSFNQYALEEALPWPQRWARVSSRPLMRPLKRPSDLSSAHRSAWIGCLKLSTFLLTCSGLKAPGMTLTTDGWPSGNCRAVSAIAWRSVLEKIHSHPTTHPRGEPGGAHSPVQPNFAMHRSEPKLTKFAGSDLTRLVRRSPDLVRDARIRWPQPPGPGQSRHAPPAARATP